MGVRAPNYGWDGEMNLSTFKKTMEGGGAKEQLYELWL